MYIDPKLFTTSTVYRNIIGDNIGAENCELSCGFMHKTKSYNYTSYMFSHYCGVLVLSGKGVYRDADGTEYELIPGSFIQRLPDRYHSTIIDFDTNWLEFFICIGRSPFLALADTGIYNCDNPVLYIGISQKLLSEMQSYMELLRTARNDELPYALIEAQKLLCEINMMSMSRSDYHETFAHSACERIKENLSVGVSIKSIAESMGMGAESFRKQFKKSVGISPGEYMISERVNAAKIMLIDNAMPIKEVAITLGYTDVTAFTKQFKAFAGITPGEFCKR